MGRRLCREALKPCQRWMCAGNSLARPPHGATECHEASKGWCQRPFGLPQVPLLADGICLVTRLLTICPIASSSSSSAMPLVEMVRITSYIPIRYEYGYVMTTVIRAIRVRVQVAGVKARRSPALTTLSAMIRASGYPSDEHKAACIQTHHRLRSARRQYGGSIQDPLWPKWERKAQN